MNLSQLGLVKTACFYCQKVCARGYGSGGKLVEMPVDESYPFTPHLCVVKITVPNEHDFGDKPDPKPQPRAKQVLQPKRGGIDL